MLRRWYISVFFRRRFYWSMVVIIMLFILSYGLGFLFDVARIALLFLLLSAMLDYMILFSKKNPVDARRELEHQFSNSDRNPVRIHLASHYPFTVGITVIDELPYQLQERKLRLRATLRGGAQQTLGYEVRPTERGEYFFHDINVFIRSPLGLLTRRLVVPAEKMVKVLPSFFALKQYELIAYASQLAEAGSKRIRKIGRSLEFEQIKEYVSGDDIRSINWKATGRKGGQLMVNSYADEKSQQVYCLIDKGRVMKMPFDGLTLLDYAINATLILSRVALVKQDKAGLVTFAEHVGDFLPADHRALQMNHILQLLYNQQTRFLETDYEKLYALVRTRITQRSLIVLFSNFESLSALRRQLPFMRGMARRHLLLVVFFENTELAVLTKTEVKDIEGLYARTIGEKFVYEKRLIVKELQQHGIATILTEPKHLTINIVNKYLEIKARQAI